MGQSWVAHTALPWWRSCDGAGRAVVAVVALQFLVPLVALAMEPPTRFGFQMYSGYGSVDLSVTDRAGVRRQVGMDHVAAAYRGEIDWLGRVPAYLCRVEPDAVSATVLQDGRTRTVPCGR
jgi:hypothetical protein